MHNYENLQIWQRSMDLTVNIYKVTVSLPNDERFGLTSQLRRAAASIPMNIAEGSGNSPYKEFRRFLEISFRSGYGVLTDVVIARRLNLFQQKKAAEISTELRSILSMIVGFMRTLDAPS